MCSAVPRGVIVLKIPSRVRRVTAAKRVFRAQTHQRQANGRQQDPRHLLDAGVLPESRQRPAGRVPDQAGRLLPVQERRPLVLDRLLHVQAHAKVLRTEGQQLSAGTRTNFRFLHFRFKPAKIAENPTRARRTCHVHGGFDRVQGSFHARTRFGSVCIRFVFGSFRQVCIRRVFGI